jgi:two-component system chemotaxis response regulator CheB
MSAPRRPQRVIAVGASTGGPAAVRALLRELPADSPAVLLVQHMGPQFTRPFVERLDRDCPLHAVVAEDGVVVLPGQVLVAPGDRHMRVVRRDDHYVVRIAWDAHVNSYRPSVDVLFDSCAAAVGEHAIGVLLTGMGQDGARGLRALRDAGAHTIAQDRQTSVVFGMPKAAAALGAAAEILALDQIAASLIARTRCLRSV